MTHSVHFAAEDLGASSGRLMVGSWNGRAFSLDELHRFPNTGVHIDGSLRWDVSGIWSEIQRGLMLYRERFQDLPAAIGVDAWGVDFALLDRSGELLGNPYHYRDARTDGIPELVFKRIGPRRLLDWTGVQTIQINILFQSYSMVRSVLMRKFGYKMGFITGLILFGTGAFLFWPAALVGRYFFFLAALFVIATGLSFLETASNPFAAQMGDPESATLLGEIQSLPLHTAVPLGATGTDRESRLYKYAWAARVDYGFGNFDHVLSCGSTKVARH